MRPLAGLILAGIMASAGADASQLHSGAALPVAMRIVGADSAYHWTGAAHRCSGSRQAERILSLRHTKQLACHWSTRPVRKSAYDLSGAVVKKAG